MVAAEPHTTRRSKAPSASSDARLRSIHPANRQAGVTGQRVVGSTATIAAASDASTATEPAGDLTAQAPLVAQPPEQRGHRDDRRISGRQVQLASGHRRSRGRPTGGPGSSPGTLRAIRAVIPLCGSPGRAVQPSSRVLSPSSAASIAATAEPSNRSGSCAPIAACMRSPRGRRSGGSNLVDERLHPPPRGAHFIDVGTDLADRDGHQPAQRCAGIRLDRLGRVERRKHLDLQFAGG